MPAERSRNGATIHAVAEKAGVSKTTVSHVLSGKRPVAAATKRNVMKVMEELGFQPNFFAQALNANRSHAIALIVQDLTNPYYPMLGRGLQLAVGDAGYVVMLFDAGAGLDFAEAAVKAAIQRRVDGVVIAVGGVDRAADALERAGIATVAVGAGSAPATLDWVSADDARIARNAVRHLYDRGYRAIAAIMGPPDREPGGRRLQGYRDEMAELEGCDEPAVAYGDWTRESGTAAMAQLLDRPTRPAAVFCANDLMAIGALDAALARGLRVPEDLAVVGVDDIDAASLVRPALTTIRIPTLEIGRTAGEMLLRRLGEQGQHAAARHVLVQHDLIVRQSA